MDFFPFSLSRSLCNLVRRSPQNVEKIARFPGGENSVESCHVCGCHVFLAPMNSTQVTHYGARKKFLGLTLWETSHLQFTTELWMNYLPPFKIPTGMKNDYRILCRALTRKASKSSCGSHREEVSTELFLGVVRAAPVPPTPGKGALTGRGLLPYRIIKSR